MKKIAASVGLIALGASCAQAADDSYSSTEAGKIWKISASLRGFYDDNVNGVSSGAPNRTSTFGFSVSPGGSLNWQRDATTVNLSYRYSLLYYGIRPDGNTSNYDQNHNFDLALSHIINERYKFRVADSFVIGQEPDSLRSGDALTSTQRIPGDNIRNTGSIVFNAELTPLFGVELGYANSLFDYKANDNGHPIVFAPVFPSTVPGVIPSPSGSSDRLEHRFHLDGRWQLLPQTTALLGYQYSQVNYTGNELVAFSLTGTPLTSKTRDSRTHYAYAGLEHVFNPDFFGSAKAGVSTTDYYNDSSNQSSLSPYVNLTASYMYAPESSIQGGFTYDRNATDTIGKATAAHGITQSQQSATVFAAISHRIIPNLFGSLTTSYQYSTYVGGQFNSQSDKYFLVGLNLRYQFAHYLSAELGYDYDNISSSTGHSYDRNKFYAGITGTY